MREKFSVNEKKTYPTSTKQSKLLSDPVLLGCLMHFYQEISHFQPTFSGADLLN